MAMLFRICIRVVGWIVYLILAINFQHFLRHGIDVFLGKVIFQMIFVFLLAELLRPIRIKEPGVDGKNSLVSK